MEVKNSIELNNDDNYIERFKTEFHQLKDRSEKLNKIIVKYEAGTLEFKPKSPLELLKQQKKYMNNYLHCLRIRAEIEGIEL